MFPESADFPPELKGFLPKAKREIKFAQEIYRELSKMENITLFTNFPEEKTHNAVISFVAGDLSGEETSEKLSEKGREARHIALDDFLLGRNAVDKLLVDGDTSAACKSAVSEG